MINKKENITTSKTIKTVLFAGLIMSLVIPVTGMNLAEAKVSEDKVPDHVLLPVSANKAFATTADSKEMLGHKALKNFIDGYSDRNKKGDNHVMDKRIKHNIVLANFDILAGKADVNLDVFLLDVQEQKASGTYNPTEAEKKLYDWGIKINPNPVMPDNIKPNMVKQVLQVWDERLSDGDVPVGLEELDQTFWNMQKIKAICLNDNICNTDDTADFLSFLPSAYASSITHLAHVSAVPLFSGCYQTTNCTLSDYKYGTGTLSTSTPASSVHSASQYVKVSGLNYIISGSQTANYSFTLKGDVGGVGTSPQSFSTYNSSLTGNHYVYTPNPCNPDGSTGCGQYSGTIVAQAPYY